MLFNILLLAEMQIWWLGCHGVGHVSRKSGFFRSLSGLLLVCKVLSVFFGRCRSRTHSVDDLSTTTLNNAVVLRNFGITAVCSTGRHLTLRCLIFGRRSFFQARLNYYPTCICCYQLSNLRLNEECWVKLWSCQHLYTKIAAFMLFVKCKEYRV